MHQALTTPPLAREAAKKRKRGRRRKILFASAGAVLLLVIGLFVAGKREKPIPVTTEKAARRTILQTVSATGKIQPETEVKISPEVAGEIIELPVEDGMQVKKGDLLLKIKPIPTKHCSNNRKQRSAPRRRLTFSKKRRCSRRSTTSADQRIYSRKN